MPIPEDGCIFQVPKLLVIFSSSLCPLSLPLSHFLPGVGGVVIVVLLQGLFLVVVKYYRIVGRSHNKEMVTYSGKGHEEEDFVGRFGAPNPVSGTLT